jgi:hypothetical protein
MLRKNVDEFFGKMMDSTLFMKNVGSTFLFQKC